jgi:hypothetical protein
VSEPSSAWRLGIEPEREEKKMKNETIEHAQQKEVEIRSRKPVRRALTMALTALALALVGAAQTALADDESPEATAGRLEGDAVRAENGGDDARAAEARAAAEHAAESDADHAREVERDYNRGVDHEEHDHEGGGE